MNSEALSELKQHLAKDRQSPYPKFPSQAVIALEDERVARAVEARFASSNPLTGIQALEYHFYAGIIPIVFEFGGSGANGLKRDGLLVLFDSACRVVGLVDPFDMSQPNPWLPPLPSTGEQPFVLSRPSAAEGLSFKQEDLHPRNVRNQEYLKKMKLTQMIGPSDGSNSWCYFTTSTRELVGSHCLYTGPVIFGMCDREVPSYEPDESGDWTQDDCKAPETDY